MNAEIEEHGICCIVTQATTFKDALDDQHVQIGRHLSYPQKAAINLEPAVYAEILPTSIPYS